MDETEGTPPEPSTDVEPKPKFDPYTGRPLEEPAPPAPPPAPMFDPVTGKPLPGTTAAQSRRRRRFLIGGAAAIVVIAALALIGLFTVFKSGTQAVLHHSKHDMTITLDLTNRPDQSIDKFSRGCDVADSGYDDLSAGAPVTVKDARGTVLASTFLPTGTDNGDICHFELHVRVPDSAFYQVAVSHRGVLTYTKAELQGRGWTVALSIGS